MKKIRTLFSHPSSLLLLAFLAFAGLAAAIWWVGPWIGVGRYRPLDGVAERLGVIGLTALVIALAAWRALRRRRLLAEAVPPGPVDSPPELGFAAALAALQDSTRQARDHRWWHGRRHLYERPWFLLLGAPGSGKSTALRQSGLGFAFGAGTGPRSARRTRYSCDWAIADEAVLIDTTGDFSLPPDGAQDVPPAPDAWQGLLSELKKARPRQPLNGVLLTLSMTQLLQRDATARRELAASLRARLNELQAQLGTRPPVYLLITKADLLAGFQETFGRMDREEREQVWGFTFPAEQLGTDSPAQAFSAEYAALEKRLRDGLLERMEAEHDPMRRAAVFAFPQQFAGIRGVLGAFLEAVFAGGDEVRQNAMLRGVYFCSAQQEGTPIDRVLDTLTRVFGIHGVAPAPSPSTARSYFLARLLREVVIPERGMVGENRRVIARTRWRRSVGMGLLLLATAALLAGWSLSYRHNSAYLSQVEGRMPALLRAVQALPPADGTDLGALPSLLDQLWEEANRGTSGTAAGPGFKSLGLAQDGALAAAALTGYRHLLEQALLPRVALRLEERLRAAGGNDLEQAYDALKNYLMLHESAHLEPAVLLQWVEQDWRANLQGSLPAAQRTTLSRHLARALEQANRPALRPMDEELVARVREMLAAYPLEYRAFSRMRYTRLQSAPPDFTVLTAAGPNAAQVFERASGQPIGRGVPDMFTRDAYLNDFRDAIAPVVEALQEERRWVLATPAVAADSAVGIVVERVRQLYLLAYIRAWDAYLADLRLARLGDLASSLDVARMLAAADSPLPTFLHAAIRQTRLGAAVGAGLPEQRPPEARVDEHFSNLHRLAAGTPPPLDGVMRLFTDAYLRLNAISLAHGNGGAPVQAVSSPASNASAAAAALQPEPVRSMLLSLADAGNRHGHQAERRGLSAGLRPLAEFCGRAIAGRFPLASGSATDVPLGDFGRFFGVGGLLDEFFQSNLAASVDTAPTPWRYKPMDNGMQPEAASSLADFQRAARIREAFFRQGGQSPAIRVEFRLLSSDPALKDLTLSINDQTLAFPYPGGVAQAVVWPGNRLTSHIVLGGGGTTVTLDGPWALLRLMQRFDIEPSEQAERFTLLLELNGRQARLEVVSPSATNPLRLGELGQFRCPDQL